jgi:hypothetical protein
MGAVPSRDEKIQWVNPHGEITSVVHDERVFISGSIFLLQPISTMSILCHADAIYDNFIRWAT